ncbi:MAG TPA: imidazole glycerol phosphate synthase subunit HisH [Synergistaceae bacterium]|nr:imidazole glycerol phosphate synthase subunit HisH [Synergistaceae bacterium]
MIGIIAYGAGNLKNLERGLRAGGFPAAILEKPQEAAGAELLILPGVGAFAPAMKALRRSGWFEKLQLWHKDKRPLFGICLGMQLLCRESHEKEHTAGLALLDASVELLSKAPKLPHMGWNSLEWTRCRSLPIAATEPEQTFYFVHSYGVVQSPHTLANTTTGKVTFASVLGKGKVLGMQFHPERSGPEGIAFLSRLVRQFLKKEWEGIQ